MSLNQSKALRTAEKYVLQGKIPAAIDEYRKVVNADPGDLTTINTLGDLYVRAGKIPDAIANFSRIADSYRDAQEDIEARSDKRRHLDEARQSLFATGTVGRRAHAISASRRFLCSRGP